MKVDGRALAHTILTTLTPQVDILKEKGVTPRLAVILVGDNASSLSFIRQKRKAAEAIGATLDLHQLPADAGNVALEKLISEKNTDQAVSGIIVQRPVPNADEQTKNILLHVTPTKDVDGFVQNSPFPVPVAAAVVKILEHIHPEHILDWLHSQKITIIGRGETAGKPIAEHLKKINVTPSIIHSQTEHPETILRESDIIISCTGRRGIIRPDTMKPNVILIGVGIAGDENNKMQGDYVENEIADIAEFYTPTPGGVGPVNVACLMENLVAATSRSI